MSRMNCLKMISMPRNHYIYKIHSHILSKFIDLPSVFSSVKFLENNCHLNVSLVHKSDSGSNDDAQREP